MENLPTYRLTQSGPEAQEILDQVNLNTTDIDQLKRLYQALNQSDPEIIEPTDTWPVANPEENVIYRVIDRVNTPPQYYSDYMWNGTSMVLMGQYNNAIDNEPTANSNNLVKSGGVYSFVHANGGAYDISAAHAVGGVLATYDDLADALGTNGANVPSAVRKGGMSIKFVSSSDNKYVRCNYLLEDATTNSKFTNVENWQQVASYESLCSLVFTNGEIANKVIKELYLYKQDGSPINDTLHIVNLGKKYTISSNTKYFLTIANSSNQNVAAWQESSISSNIVEIEIEPKNSSGIYGKAILDFSKIADGYYTAQAIINACAFDIKCSPYIYSKKNTAERFSNVLDTKTLSSLNNKLGINGFKVNIVATSDTGIRKVAGGVNSYSLLLIIKSGDVINIKTGRTSLLSILKDFNSDWLASNFTSADISTYYATGETRRQILNTEETITVTASDAKYLMVALNTDTDEQTWLPDSLSINGVNIPLYSFNNKFSLLESNIQELSATLEERTVLSRPEEDITNSAILTANKYLKKDGVTVVDNQNNFYIAELLLDNDVSTVSVTGTHFASGASLVFKDSNENIIGNVITVTSTVYGTITADKPLNATKAYTTYRNGGSGDRPIVFKVVHNITVKSEIVKAKIVDYQFTEDKTIDIGLVRGSANAANGGVVENSSFAKTDKVDVSHYDFIRIYNRFSDNICYTKWFNDSNEEVLPRGIGDDTSGHKYMTFEKPEGATKVEISVIEFTGDKYIEFGKYNNTVTSDENGFLQQMEILSLPNVSMIPIFGQSLSVGAAATPPISTQCKYPAGIMFATGIIAVNQEVSYFTDFAPLEEISVETVASGCCEQLIGLLQKENGINAKSKFWQDHKFLFVSCGQGSSTIEMLMENNYQGLLNAVQGGKNVANSKGWTFNVPAVIYIQGETDQKPSNATSYNTYKAALQNFATTFNTDVKQITGQKKDVKVIMYQTCSQRFFFSPTFANYTAMDVPTAQMDLINEEPNFCACNPAYMLDHSTSQAIHLSAVGEKMMGEYCGISLKQMLIDNFKFNGLTLNSHTVDNNSIILDLNVPCPPLRIDTQFVKEVTNYGFKVIKSDDSDIITSVAVYDNQVVLTCSESPIGCKLYYGFNGTSGKDGRKLGARGNICDSGDCIYNGEIGNSKYPLRNYLYAFCVSLS